VERIVAGERPVSSTILGIGHTTAAGAFGGDDRIRKRELRSHELR